MISALLEFRLGRFAGGGAGSSSCSSPFPSLRSSAKKEKGSGEVNGSQYFYVIIIYVSAKCRSHEYLSHSFLSLSLSVSVLHYHAKYPVWFFPRPLLSSNCLFVPGTRSWNTLPFEIQSSKSLGMLKFKLKLTSRCKFAAHFLPSAPIIYPFTFTLLPPLFNPLLTGAQLR